MASKRTRQAVGATAGVVVGGAASAAVGVVVTKATNAVAGTRPVISAAQTIARVSPSLARTLPHVGTGLGLAVSAYALYQALKPVVANAQEARNQKAATKAQTKAETMEEAEARLGQRFGGSPNDIRKAAENERRAMTRAKDQKTRDYHERRAIQMERRFKEVTGEHIGPTVPGPAPSPAVPPAPPAAPQGSVWQDLKGMFKSNPEFDQRRSQIMRELDSVRTAVANEISGKNASGQKGAGRNYDKLVARQRELEGSLKELAKEERDSNPLKQGFVLGAQVGAVLGGYALGSGWMAGTSKLKDAAATSGAAVEKLGRAAEKVLKLRPNSIIAGTPSGDRAKAIVNEAYAIGGAKPAFPSPGYPGSSKTAQQIFSKAGRARPADYVPAGLNLAMGTAAIGASFIPGQPESLRQTERIVGAFELALGVGQIKALSTAPVLRPAAGAVSAIEALRNRVVREAATGAPAGVAIAKGAGNLATARGAAQVAGIRAGARVSSEGARASGRVGAAQLRARTGVIDAGRDVGVAKARGAAAVQRAEVSGKLSVSRAVKKGEVGKYKDVWQDKNGRIYHRRDMTVRTAKGKSPSNDNGARRSASR